MWGEDEERESLEGFGGGVDADFVGRIPGGENLCFVVWIFGTADTVTVGDIESELLEIESDPVGDTGRSGRVDDGDLGIFEEHERVVENEIREFRDIAVGVDMTRSRSVREEDRGTTKELTQWSVEESSALAVGESLETGIVEIE